MLAYTYIKQGKFELIEKPKPELKDTRDAIVRVTLSSICTSDLHIKHGGVPRAVPGVTIGHEMVGVVEQTGADVTLVKPGDRVVVNVETFCGKCFFCQHGYVNNCIDPNGGWALGCRIDGGQTEYVRVPYADQGLSLIPETVTDEQALFVGDILATGFWAARISEITEEDTVLIIGAGPTGICTLLSVMLKNPQCIIVCEKAEERIHFVREHYPQVEVVTPEKCKDFVLQKSAHGGADVVLEVAGGEETFRLAWECARPNAIVTIVALYDRPQILPLPDMYGKNLIFKTGGVDGCSCDPLNRRAVRVSMGSVFLIPWAWMDGTIRDLRWLGFRTAAMALTENSISIDHPSLAAEPRLAIVMGTEGEGLSQETIVEADYVVRIPMAHGVDSLNVAAAAAVAFWQLRAPETTEN